LKRDATPAQAQRNAAQRHQGSTRVDLRCAPPSFTAFLIVGDNGRSHQLFS
jgi:hypothetical protein